MKELKKLTKKEWRAFIKESAENALGEWEDVDAVTGWGEWCDYNGEYGEDMTELIVDYGWIV